MANYKPMPPYDELSWHLKYDPITGVGTWLVSRKNKAQKGALAGCLGRDGYVYIRYKAKLFLAHRLFWFLQTGHDPGALEVDHIDRNRSNNKFYNLRLANKNQQGRNKSERIDNTSGHRGVCWDKESQKYAVQIFFNKKMLKVGRYKTFEQAVAARQAKELELFGEFSPLYRLNND